MSADARARLGARTYNDYANGGHRTVFVPDLNDVANVVTEAVNADTDAIKQAGLAAASLASMVALGPGGTQGIGVPDPDRVPLGAFLGSAAFADLDAILGIQAVLQNAAYQMVSQDRGSLLVCSSGTQTWTLPLSSDVPWNWFVRYKNRSGNNLTIARTGADTIDGAAANLTVVTATSGYIVRIGAGFEHA
jgi:hypothetical protein